MRIVVDGLAASVASIICMAASPGELIVSEGSVLMVHDARSATVGDAQAMRDTADLLNKMSDNMANIYARRAGLPAARLVDRVAG